MLDNALKRWRLKDGKVEKVSDVRMLPFVPCITSQYGHGPSIQQYISRFVVSILECHDYSGAQAQRSDDRAEAFNSINMSVDSLSRGIFLR